METKKIVSWLRDKAARADDLSWQRMMSVAADRLEMVATDNNVGGNMDFCGELCNFAEGLIEKAKEPKWIPVTERLPESDATVLCLLTHGGCWVSTWDHADDQMWSDGEYWCSKNGVTHWMPLPEPPKGD